jgi:hypothetical protein
MLIGIDNNYSSIHKYNLLYGCLYNNMEFGYFIWSSWLTIVSYTFGIGRRSYNNDICPRANITVVSTQQIYILCVYT